MKKVVFVAHPISGDIQGNIVKVLALCREIHTHELIPLAPYIVSLQYLDDTISEERLLGIEADAILFERYAFDELWLLGDRISEGMKAEISLAERLGIPVVPKTEGTKKDYSTLTQ